ncbi:DUF2087 domain-containing protein [Photorhabdus bodei]|uniref:DUF2087 domain-containing protein n=1 Tax=Photorhabdus bodei TaxID=2029681 RepID=UPI001E5D7CFF|nr:DUF2087 domain-containing protein [Photorhabdus bodei]MCC8466824.1 DUF2087 domain-containing protein [Photorhabdus bodei]
MFRIGMGTENCSLILKGLIKMLRPNTVIEIGAGDSTISLLQALKETIDEFNHDKEILMRSEWNERHSLIIPFSVDDSYNPKLISIDDGSGEGSSAEDVWKYVENEPSLSQLVSFIKKDFHQIKDSEISNWGMIDFAWIDAGTLVDDVRFLSKIVPYLSYGGIICLHEPLMTTTIKESSLTKVRTVRNPIWEEISTNLSNDFELITIPENHKYRQAGIGLLRKKDTYECTRRTSSFQDEMLTLNEPPIKFAIPDIINRSNNKINKFFNIFNEEESRLIYALILAGHNRINEVKNNCNIPIKTIEKTIKKLLDTEIILMEDGVLKDNTEFWNHSVFKNKYRQSESKSCHNSVYNTNTLLLIANQLRDDVSYTEDLISDFCSLFDDDYAQLRRALVDNRLLTRNNEGIYFKVK